MNCGLCGRHLSRFEMQKWKKDERPICRECRKEELRKNVEMASPSQIQFLKLYTDDADLIDEIIRERKLKEQITPTEPPEPSPPPKPKEVELDEYGCRIGEEEWNDDLHQCIKIEKEKGECVGR